MKEISIKWSVEDIQVLRPEWSLDKCEKFLSECGKIFKELSIADGWETWRIMSEGAK